MAVTPIPDAPVVPQYPALGSATFNQEAYAYGTAMPNVTQRIHEIAQAARSNAVESGAQALLAADQVQLAADQVQLAADQVQLAADQVGLAADQVQLAADQATLARTSALSAGGAANYQGDYDPLKTYTVGQSVSHSGQRFAAKRTVTGVTPADGADWLLLLTGGGPTLQGDISPYLTQTKTYQITNYSSFSSYSVQASAGTASISGDTITYIAPGTAGTVSLTLTVDGQPTVFAITVQDSPPYIPTPTPTPANFGDPLEGGFYAGMIWNQLAQSSTSMVIATGSKTFSVPSMVGAPIVYQGQRVEVRSRADPANKFIGTVTGALGTNLTINVTSIGGSGTFSDWSVMARHRVIVAPKASGEHAGIALKNANSELPTACQTLTEGFAATQAMRDADSSTVYPAAHWARNLDIGGRTDWYIPARDELELCWRNLKPVTNNNYVTANRPVSSLNYANNGSYGDTADTHGLNNNSAPTGAAYTAAVPAQTAAAAFRTGGTEAYEFGPAYYWSSSDYNASNAWYQYWHSSYPGFQNNFAKSMTFRVRAVRRSVI